MNKWINENIDHGKKGNNIIENFNGRISFEVELFNNKCPIYSMTCRKIIQEINKKKACNIYTT